MSALRLHWRPGTAAMAPHAALAEIGVEYDLARVELNADGEAPAAYLRLNPSGLVPTLETGELVLTEAAAILLHLADAYPEARLMPPLRTVERSDAYRWLLHLTNTLQNTLLRLHFPERYGESGVRTSAAAAADRELAAIERHLEGRHWLVGETRGAPDLFLFMLTRWGRILEPPAWERPAIRSHFLRTLALPGVRRMMDEQGLDLPPFATHP
jgi:glutathione S-transferase